MTPERRSAFGRVRSFGARLIIFAVLASVVAALLVSITLVATQQLRIRALVTEHLQSQGEVIAFNVAATITFDRPDEAAAALTALSGVDHLVSAYLFDAEGELFASHHWASAREPPSVSPMPAGVYQEGDWLVHQTPVLIQDQPIGTLALVYDPRWMADRFWFDLGAAGLIMALAMAAAVFIALRLQTALAQPVRELIATSRIVSETGDYSVAAERFEQDEMGELTDAFNAMLARIKQQTAEVQEANERFQVAVEASPNGMVMVDQGGRILLVNAAMEALFGYARDELLGLPVEILVPARFREEHPGHRKRFLERPDAREMGAGRDLYGRRKDGSEFPVEIGLNPIRTEHGLRVLSAIVDITERKRAEAELLDRERRLTTLTNAVPAFVWNAGADGRVSTVNDRWYEYTGTSSGTPIDEAMSAVLHPDDRERTQLAWQQARSAGIPFETEFRIRRHDGSYRWFLARAVPLREEDGAISEWFGTSTDIEDRKRAEMERDELLTSERAARSEAERASHMKDEFVATLSHELRTPLTAIVGWSQILQLKPADEALVAQGLESIERNAKVQAEIIEDLLDMSRIVSGKIRLDVQLVELPDVLDAALDTVRPAAEQKGVRLEKIVDPRAAPVYGDVNRLQQIIWNILSNAVKFTPRGGRVQLALQRVNSHVEIAVSDTGEGIDPDFLPHLFERFRQADASSSRAHTGLGIGLSLVRYLTELHGGTVTADSPGKGQGATFTVSLPVAIMHRPAKGDGAAREHPTRSLPGASQPALGPLELKNIRVMIVEDERDAREFLTRLLEGAKAQVCAADSAAEALKKVTQFKPDVVVSDIGMPDMDGYGFIRELRQRPASEGGRTPAVALTAFARSEDRTRALMAGYQMHIAKPVEPTELLATIVALASLDRRGVPRRQEADARAD
jgi:PAS domain S-box-containing protein